MQEQSIINSIKRGVIAPIYLIYGTEEYLQEIIINTLKEALGSSEMGSFNLEELEGEEVALGSLVDLANTLPIFAEKRLIIVKNPLFLQSGGKKKEEEEEEGKAFSPQTSANNKREEKRLLDYLADPLISTCLVFWQQGNVDKRRKIYKAIVANNHQVVAINPLRGRKLNEWLNDEAKKMGKKLEPRVVDYLLFNCGNQLRDLHHELEKLSLYSGEETIITLKMAQMLTTKSSEGNIFNLVDSIGHQQTGKALHELRNLLTLGESPIKIIHMIARQFRLMLVVKDLMQREGYTDEKIITELKLHPYVMRKIKQQTYNFSFTELEKNLVLIWRTDLGMKTGLKQNLALENLVIALTPK